ncbi:MAG: AmmeMemoRadiSam system protein A [Peptococcaceae bacterium]|jgi:AmmeMemoRadiSam system protein A/AmmeMemoRadiSam system protein B|nr:AmmeMemoRadiSam system protein A [Peptococcaceae bacterium]
MSIVAAYAVPHPPLILPEVGRGQEKGIQATIDAYRRAAADFALRRPETVVLISPHAQMYADYFHIAPGAAAGGDMRAFGARQPRTEALYDQEFVAALADVAKERGLPAGTLGEKRSELDHGTVVPLRFFQAGYSDFRLALLGLSGLSALEHYRLGQCLAETAERLGRRTAVIASGDLSHKLKADGPYGFAPAGPEFDQKVMAALGAGDFQALLGLDPDLCEAAAECGLRAFQIMAGALDGRAVEAARLSYEGPFGVGYGVCVFIPGEAAPDRRFGRMYQVEAAERIAGLRRREDLYVALARYSLERYVEWREKVRRREDLPAELSRELAAPANQALTQSRAGAFVSLRKEGRLRGCIGTIEPTKPSLLEEILTNAVSAGARDPRFPPVTAAELGELVYHVDVLGPPEPIAGMAALDVRRYGVIVSAGGRRGLLLPDLAGVDTPARQVEIALEKAGIRPGEAYRMERFEVTRHQ